uniref:Putative ovule protein n=1 Tax=Solanum chacoense TaxID=4108 RepID=A0A0V0HKZ4_SOLCH
MSWLALPTNFTPINMYLFLDQFRKVKFDECCEVTKWTQCKYSHFSTRGDKSELVQVAAVFSTKKN